MICLFSPARDNFCQPSGKLSGNRPTLFHCGLRLMTLVCIAIQFSNLLSAQQPSMDESAEQRMKFMQQSGRTYDVTDKSGSRLRFVDEPALRWTNPVSGVSDGGLFFWCDQDGKPHAAAQIFLIPKTQRKWLHEFQSLSESTFTFNYEGRPVWSPKSAGVEFKPLPIAMRHVHLPEGD
ncbi:hypothetical protein [Rhodopirellula sp. MGV]|uniref:hypothetical protein n=1 Tax=Rhodopirellula sp. MGV TaxID=2023130 RepID=UPI000B969DDB|nr:hypothetical protein [Rhodopirellula sp. MGV]OYP35176.1 hypothetical protein CGZ80_12310 [Rhodopirellula sp. MGV]PNY37810.1 hypothetical protein C2E31_05990 [Rhodopirellula baltica]